MTFLNWNYRCFYIVNIGHRVIYKIISYKHGGFFYKYPVFAHICLNVKIIRGIIINYYL